MLKRRALDRRRPAVAMLGLTLGVALLASGCETTTEPRGEAVRLRILPIDPVLLLDEPLQLVAELEDVSGRSLGRPAVTWTSADTTIVVVDANGVLRGVRPGAALVTGTGGGVTGQAQVRVLDRRAFQAQAHMCAVDVDFVLWCWGRGRGGELGTGDRTDRPQPTLTEAGTAVFRDVSAGWGYTCATYGPPGWNLWCWGSGTHGRLGMGDGADRLVPTPSFDPAAYEGVAGGGLHGCGWRVGNRVTCWGNASWAQLGTIAGDVATPVDLPILATQVTSGDYHACAVTESGGAVCWGRNDDGQVGMGSRGGPIGPADVLGGETWLALSAGARHTCGITSDGEARCWGAGASGELGLGSFGVTRARPIAVDSELRWSAISAGGAHTCAIATDGSAHCWGSNAHGQLGTGDRGAAAAPRPVAGGGTFVDLSTGHDFTCALDVDGVAHCWGANTFGQLGTGDFVDRLTPTAVAADTAFARLALD